MWFNNLTKIKVLKWKKNIYHKNLGPTLLSMEMPVKFLYRISTNFLFQIQQNLLKLNNCWLLFLRILNYSYFDLDFDLVCLQKSRAVCTNFFGFYGFAKSDLYEMAFSYEDELEWQKTSFLLRSIKIFLSLHFEF